VQEKVREIVSRFGPVTDKVIRRWQLRGVPKDQPFTRMIPTGLDYRGVATAECLCGGAAFFALLSLDTDTYEVAQWDLCGLCAECGALVTLGCPIDVEVRDESSY
jgi:hypothetical protein